MFSSNICSTFGQLFTNLQIDLIATIRGQFFKPVVDSTAAAEKLSLKKVGLAFNDQFCDWHCNEERIILFSITNRVRERER